MPDANVMAAVVAVLVPVIAFGRWLVKLEGRQDKHEAVCAERQKHLADALSRIERTQAAEHAENKVTLHNLHKKIDALAEG